MHLIIQLLILVIYLNAFELNHKNSTVGNEESQFSGNITLKEVNFPHNLFIGRCTKDHPILHQEHVVMDNDGKSHVTANIRMDVEGFIQIACVNIYDENPEVSAYPTYGSGGIGFNYIEFNIYSTFGKGFHFFVQILGQKNDLLVEQE